MSKESSKRIAQLRDGSVVVAVIETKTEKGDRHSVTLSRIFKRDESADWEQSQFLRADDCLKAAELLREAHSVIKKLRQG